MYSTVASSTVFVVSVSISTRIPEEEESAEATIEKLAVTVVPGDLLHECTDAVVNPTNDRLANAGEVSERLLRAGGPAIRENCELLRCMLLMSYYE